MNPTSRAILQTVLTTDDSLSLGERGFLQGLLVGRTESHLVGAANGEQLLVTQKRAAEILSVNRVTIWRMTRDRVLHPVEIIPGTWRYPIRELAQLAQAGETMLSHLRQRHQAQLVSPAA
jgi:hypothetical protein